MIISHHVFKLWSQETPINQCLTHKHHYILKSDLLYYPARSTSHSICLTQPNPSIPHPPSPTYLRYIALHTSTPTHSLQEIGRHVRTPNIQAIRGRRVPRDGRLAIDLVAIAVVFQDELGGVEPVYTYIRTQGLASRHCV